MALTWTDSQHRRLKELNAAADLFDSTFLAALDRERAFQRLEKKLMRTQRSRLDVFRETIRQPGLCRLERRLSEVLIQQGFVQVTTPIIMSRGHVAKMSIDADHPLQDQIFWLDRKRCLRPMLAPHLYFVLKDLLRVWEKPLSLFEIGPCFRKESTGRQHADEFTMLNLVEMGLPLETRSERLHELAQLIIEAADIKTFELISETSDVYGETVDVVTGKEKLELGSAAMGPHPLDQAWKITEPWVGIGFGVERLLMVATNSGNLARMGRSLTYLDGVCLNIQ